MKVYVSVDMEGVTGVTDPEDVTEGAAGYERARALMTADANAAIRGAFQGGASYVLVNDAHSTMRNLLVEELDPRARLVRGFHKPLCMMQGLDDSFSAALLVGCHARAGAGGGILEHTLLGKQVHELWCDGEPIGEIGLNALLAGSYGVPIAFVAGDDVACREAEHELGPEVETFAVKRAIDRFVANCLPPEKTAVGICEAVARAIGGSPQSPLRRSMPLSFGLTFNSSTIAATCALLPGVRRTGARSTEFSADAMPEAMERILIQLLLALQVGGTAGGYG